MSPLMESHVFYFSLLRKKPSQAQMVKNPPVMMQTWVRSLGQEDTLEKGMATHSSILARRIPWTEEVVSYSPWGHKELDTTERLTLSLSKV